MKNTQKHHTQVGFTLLEILLVIAAIGILAAIVIVAINPQRQLAQVRNTQRQSDVFAIQSALEQYLIDEGDYPADITTTLQDICLPPNTISCVSIAGEIAPQYLASIPENPGAPETESGYMVAINPLNGKVTVEAKYSDLNAHIHSNSRDYPLRVAQQQRMAYSLRRLSLSYDGPIIRVRRAGDNAEQDIGIAEDGRLDWATLESFSQGGNVFVRTWYDQSGTARNLVQATLASQPQILSNGQRILRNGHPAVYFNGIDDFMGSQGTVGVPTKSLLIAVDFSMANSTSELFGVARNSAFPGSFGLRPGLFLGWDNAITNTGIPIPLATSSEITELYLTLQNTQVRRNGVISFTDSRIFTQTNSSLNLGSRIPTGFFAEAYLYEFLIFEGDTRIYGDEISTNMNQYYQVY